ncbi:hypothetical protein [Methylophilus sp. Leaf414]|uniref:hypothetical protein n=1 Tax=Methylophilus sp. Leaf414 TaxID=1736371 RepID=UPI0006F6D735|nr:hypothetical protein [Methylophilus sp. Leaf414]KQT37665.1 hypothetical protein ASG24_01330 [Methylophilus sp. Leaf414]
MDIKNAQVIIDELTAICIKHKVALIGGSVSDNIHGEIRLVASDDLSVDDIDHLSSGETPYKVQGITVVNGIA